MLFYKIFLIFIIQIKSFFSYKSSNSKKALFISVAGIGDSIYLLSAIQYYYHITGEKSDILIPKSSSDIFLNSDFINKIFITNPISQIDFKDYGYIFSNRINITSLFAILKSGFTNKFFENPNYEKLRLISRFRCIFSQAYKKRYFSQFHAGLQFNNIIKDIFNFEIDFPKPIIKSVKPSGNLINNFLKQNIHFGIIHVAGQDEIRKIDPILIHDITESIKFPLILVGSIDDVSLYSKLGYNKSVYNGLGEFSLNEVLYLLENSNFCIAPDSSIMHLASITNTKIIGIMGNALEQTFGPLFSINKFILSRNASCSPCSKSVCHKYDGHSCVQDISLSEIINYI
jgi:hypothetical protein